MNISSTAVKKTALTALKGKYLSAVIASAIYIFSFLVCIFCAGIVSTVAGGIVGFLFFVSASAFLIVPLTLGLAFFGVRTVFCTEAHPILIFEYFISSKKYTRALNFSLPFTLNAVIAGIILFLPAGLVDVIASSKIFTALNMHTPALAESLSGVSAVLKIVAFLCLIFVMMKYYLAPFLLAADSKMTASEAIKISKIIARSSKRDFVWLILSFGLYIIACVFMVPLIFIFPYFTAAYAVHCRYAVASHNRNADRLNSINIPSFSADISF